MRKIAVVSGTRSEYGLLYWIIQEIKNNPELELQLIVTGMHLSPEFGLTVNQIEKDGFPICKRIEMLLSSDTAVGISKSMGLAMISFADVFTELQPDIVLVVGDRFEIFSAVSAAMIAKIPIAHCHGGEITEGAIDESIRHAITKMSHIHFVSTNEYRKRVIQLGENPECVFNVGALGIENINRIQLLNKAAFQESINFELGNFSALVTFHPVTLDKDSAETQFDVLLSALKEFPDLKLIFTKANADADGRIINQMIDQFVNTYPERSCAFVSLGQLRYLSALKYVNMVIGNSSSGILEAPSFHIPTINIGERQSGRIAADSVIQCANEVQAICTSIKKASNHAFVSFCKNVINPYDNGNASEKILDVLKSMPLENIVKKKFYNISVDQK
jgi:GDP/UDP-N,N'-diacetylbacillosamine 2-epimerase (hydrolysing)